MNLLILSAVVIITSWKFGQTWIGRNEREKEVNISTGAVDKCVDK